MPMMVSGRFDQVLSRARAGDEDAWRCLVQDLGGRVLRYLRAQRANEPEELLADVFLDTARGLSEFAGDEAAFEGWIFGTARRRVLELRPSHGPSEGRATDRAWALLDELADDQRDVLLLRVVAGLSVDQTALAMGKRPGTVGQLQRRALHALRRRLGEGHEDDRVIERDAIRAMVVGG